LLQDAITESFPKLVKPVARKSGTGLHGADVSSGWHAQNMDVMGVAGCTCGICHALRLHASRATLTCESRAGAVPFLAAVTLFPPAAVE